MFRAESDSMHTKREENCMRATARIVAVLGVLLMLFGPTVADAEKKKTKKEQEQDCNDAYDKCAKAADEWFEGTDKHKEENIDLYGQMLDGCRVRKKWCKEEISRTRNTKGEANVPPKGGGVIEPGPPSREQGPGRPTSGGVSPK
jgi:hypothetical protein